MSFVQDGKRYLHGTDYDTEFDFIGLLEDAFGPDNLTTDQLSFNTTNDLHAIMQKVELPENATQLNIGLFADVRMVVSSSRVCSDITLAEYTSKTRRMLMKWLKGEDAGFSWTHFFEYIGQKEGRTVQEVENRTRAAIKEVLACDLSREDIFGVARLPQFDLVTVQFLIDITSKDVAEYNAVVMRVSSFIKPGGYIVIIMTLNETFYAVRGKACRVISLTRNIVDNALALAGFEHAEWSEHDKEVDSAVDYDATSYVTLVARKKN